MQRGGAAARCAGEAADDEADGLSLSELAFEGCDRGAEATLAESSEGQVESDGLVEALEELLGTRCVNASEVERTVQNRCDTENELSKKRGELSRARQEEIRLQHISRLKNDVGGDTGAEAEAAKADFEKARAKRRKLEADVQELVGRSAAQANELSTLPTATSKVSQARAAPRDGQAPGPPRPPGPPGPPRPALPINAGGQPGAPTQWTSLKTEGKAKAPLVLDRESDDDGEAPRPALSGTTEQASSSSASRPSRLAPGVSPVTRLPQEAGNSTMSAKEYLARFRSTSAAPAPGVSRAGAEKPPQATAPAKPLQASTSSASSGARPRQSLPSKAETAKYTPPVFSSSRAAKRGTSGSPRAPSKGLFDGLDEDQTLASLARSAIPASPQEAKKEIKEEPGKAEKGAGSATAKNAASPSSPPAKSAFRIDVKQLTPKNSGGDFERWKQAYPSEWRAMQREGETVSPKTNILSVTVVKSKKRPLKEDAAPTPPKARRDDDTSESAFLRRQREFGKHIDVAPSSALAAKTPVDDFGQPVAKSEVKKEAEEKDEKKLKRSMSTLHDDVQVCDGLRAPRWLWEALYGYQQTCVKWLWDLQCQRMGGILADEMGLGKTVQIAAYLGMLHHSGVLQSMRVQSSSLGSASAASSGGILIVCPATLIAQWKQELHTWYPPLRVCVMHQVGEKERKEAINIASTQGVLITSYETMKLAYEILQERTWVIVILDEGQKIRNPHANVTIAAKQFSTPHRIILSGSPIQNNLQELWSLFDFISPGRLGTLPVFLEEFAGPIEQGNLVGASDTKVAAAYQCAMALRELTQPCILRRTKAECMQTLQLPHKQEQVLFCNLTCEQYQVYIDFLQTDQVRKALSASEDRRAAGAAFFSISVLRKLCNHPDLLLLNADEDMKPPDMFNHVRSGKMKVLVEIMKKWKAEGHRCLVFVQTVQMLNVLERWMDSANYTNLRIDGKTPVKRRLKMIDEFNGNEDIFAMVLTTRVGGVGLNIIGADRVVIFDPDWNPMTDVQARERAWRIGQRRDVIVYRLVLSGTVEEKIYQRQVYKHFLSQKILNDPRQRQFFKWNDLADLFEIPPMPKGFSTDDMLALKRKYRSLFAKLKPGDDEEGNETTDVMKAISELPTKEQHVESKDAKAEHRTILQTLYDAEGIKASFNHDKVEQPLLDRKIIREGASMIASRALSALQRSSRERASHHISEPTWTGQRGRAGAAKKQPVKREVKSEFSAPNPAVTYKQIVSARTGVNSSDILEGLKQLAAIRKTGQQRNKSQSDQASEKGFAKQVANGGDRKRVKTESGQAALQDLPEAAGTGVGLPCELHSSDRAIAEGILATFLDLKLAGTEHQLTTGQVLEHLANKIASHHTDLFKTLLRQVCVLTKPSHPGEPGVWTLKPEFWPR